MGLVESEDKVTLANIGNGAASEMFDLAFQDVMDNMLDVDRPPEARTITLKLKFTPDENHREEFVTEVSCKTALAAHKPFKSRATIKPERDGHAAYEMVPRQQPLFDNVEQLRKEDESQ